MHKGSAVLSCAARALEEDLLGWELPPLDIVFAEGSLEQDDPSEWCPRCGGSVGAGECRDGRCAACRERHSSIDATIRLTEYGGAYAGRILQVKHARWHALAFEFGRRLGTRSVELLPPELKLDMLVAIPMPWIRRWHRGIDHADEIARGVASVTHAQIVRPLRQRQGQTQVSRSPTERRRAAGRFALRPSWTQPELRPGGLLRLMDGRGWFPRRLGSFRSIGLVDDVRTTGATLEQAARLLRAAGARRVVALVIAVAPDPSRRRRTERGSRPQLVDVQGIGSG